MGNEATSATRSVRTSTDLSPEQKELFQQLMQGVNGQLKQWSQQRQNEDFAAWEAKYGRPYPHGEEDWTRLLAEFGMSLDTIHGGRWKLSEVMPLIEGRLLAARRNATPLKKNARRKRGQPRKLTAKQRVALDLYAKHHGKYAEIAREMGITRQAATDFVEAAWNKAPELRPKRATDKIKRQQMPTDARGQINCPKSK